MITSLISIAVALGSFIYTANVVWNFTIFLSSSNDQHKSYNEGKYLLKKKKQKLIFIKQNYTLPSVQS